MALRKGIHIGPGVIRLMIALFALAVLAMVVREAPAIRRYIKSETM
ncbi:hypothetical protein [Actinomadura chokoriensis]|uniref:Uncharacterized protein n=1 Tax=Actinomadura chokoriensis TaxID=454156 RepID=A0ABV4QND4_9ACTN